MTKKPLATIAVGVVALLIALVGGPGGEVVTSARASSAHATAKAMKPKKCKKGEVKKKGECVSEKRLEEEAMRQERAEEVQKEMEEEGMMT